MSPLATTLVGTVLLGVFVGVAAACISFADWVVEACDIVKLPAADRWVTAASANAGLLLVGTMFLGFWAIPAGIALLATEFFLFARTHDSLVPEKDRALTPTTSMPCFADSRPGSADSPR